MPYFRDDYVLQTVDADYLAAAVKPKQFINIDQSECIQCEGCVDICPWKCIWYLAPGAVDEAVGADLPRSDGADLPGLDPQDNAIFIIDDDVCTRCALCVDRCPTGVITLGKVTNNPPTEGDVHGRTHTHGYAYGMRL